MRGPGRGGPSEREAAIEREAQELFRELATATVLRTALGGLRRLVDADLLAMLAPTAACPSALGCRAALGNRSPLTGLALPAGAGAAGRALATGRAVRGPGRPPDPPEPPEPPEPPDQPDQPDQPDPLAAAEGLLHQLAVPLLHDDVALAVVLAGRRRPEPFGRADLDVVRRFGVFVGMALVAARDRARAEEVAVLRERRRIALRLHDSVGQKLFGTGVAVRLARESAGTGRDDLVGRLQAVEQQLGRTGAAFRRALRDLDSPPASRAALGVTLSEQLEAFRHRCRVRAHLVVLGEWRPVPAPVEDLLAQVVIESLSNVERHSRATEVVVSLWFEPETVGVVLQDDGVGPVPGAGTGTGWGIARLRDGCRRLGGDLALTRGEDGGATLRAWLRCP
jgi:LuxR family transcriptional regulator, regulator of acetate metabolism